MILNEFQLIIGNFGMSEAQEKAQMAVWVVLGSPLLMSTDLGSLSPNSKALLLNKDLINVNNDPLGKAGIRVFKVTISISYKMY